MKVSCSVCASEKNSEKCHEVVLSAEEKAQLAEQGVTADRFWYCNPCWRLIRSANAEKFMANLAEARMLRDGVPRGHAKRLAEQYRKGLEDKRKK